MFMTASLEITPLKMQSNYKHMQLESFFLLGGFILRKWNSSGLNALAGMHLKDCRHTQMLPATPSHWVLNRMPQEIISV